MILLAVLTLQQAIAAWDAGRHGEAEAAFAQLGAVEWLGAAQLEYDPALAEQTLRRAPRTWRSCMLLGVAVAMQIGDASILRKPGMASEVKKLFDRAAALAPREVAPHEALLGYYIHAPWFVGGGEEPARREAEIIARLDRFAGLLAAARISGDFAPARAAARSGEQLAALARASGAVADFRAAVAARPLDARLRAEYAALLPDPRAELKAALALDPLLRLPSSSERALRAERH